MEHKRTVKDGYNTIADQYLESRIQDGADVLLLEEFCRMLPARARVLDAGCGAGLPVSKILSEKFDVIGVDFSEVQIELAKKNVPNGKFICQDMTRLDFPVESFDGICSFYAIIHIPREEHRALFKNFYQILAPDGKALLCLGAEDLPEDMAEDYHGHPMYWSHYDAATNISMLEDIGFRILISKTIPDEIYGSEHLFILAQKENSPK